MHHDGRTYNNVNQDAPAKGAVCDAQVYTCPTAGHHLRRLAGAGGWGIFRGHDIRSGHVSGGRIWTCKDDHMIALTEIMTIWEPSNQLPGI